MKFFSKGRKVVFKRRTANFIWRYQEGVILRDNYCRKVARVSWLQDYNKQTEDIPYEDIVCVDDKRCKRVQIGSYRGRARILQEIVREGT